MTHHPAEATLHALVDGELAPSAAVTLEAHVAACAECAATVASLERLARMAALAPSEVPPPEALWPAIRDALRIAPQVAVERPSRSRVARLSGSMRMSASRALAAAAILVVLGSAAGLHALRTVGREQTVRITTADERSTRDESLALGELLRELEARRPLLAPQTIVTVEAQLRAINAAIDATQQALEADPRNQHLATMLEHSRRSREEFLRTTLSLAAEL